MSQLDIAAQWMRAYFMEHPEASIDHAAREAKKENIGMHKSDISRIRRDVRMAISKHSVPGNAVVQTVQEYDPTPREGPRVREDRTLKPPFNAPHIKLDEDDPEADMTVDEVLAREAQQIFELTGVASSGVTLDAVTQPPMDVPDVVEPTPEVREVVPEVVKTKAAPRAKPVRKAPGMMEDRMENAAAKKRLLLFLKAEDPKVRWAAEQASKKPLETTLALNRRLAEKFGDGFPMPKLGEITRLAREAQGIPTKPTRPRKKKLTPAIQQGQSLAVKASKPPVSFQQGRGRPKKLTPVDANLKSFVKALRGAGLYGQVNIAQNGTFTFDLKQEVVTGYSGMGAA